MDSQNTENRSESEQQARARIRRELAQYYPCHVLVTCSEPTADGQMHVEMSYEGDPTLAAYLLDGAQSALDDGGSEEDPFRLEQL